MWNKALFFISVAMCFSLEARDWRKLTSDHFELYTTAGEAEAKHAIEHFERVRTFFSDTMGMKPVSVNRVRLVGFSSEKEYKPYQIGEFAFAYYMATPDRDYIVMQSLSQNLFEVATHEYMHLLVKHSGMKIPIWLNEGLADLFSTLRPVAGKIEVGGPLAGRSSALSQYKWLPVEQIFDVGHASREYTEKDRAGIFYAQSWALTHMVMLSQEYRPRASDFLKQINTQKPTVQVFRELYGKDPGRIKKDLEEYTHRNTIRVVQYDAKLAKKVDNIQSTPADPADANLVLAHVLSSTAKTEQAATLLHQLEREHPNNAEVHETLGYMELRAGKEQQALDRFARAAASGTRNARMYRDYAALLQQKGPEGRTAAIDALRSSLAIEPEFEDARYQLASALIQERRYGEAFAELAKERIVKEEKAYWFFRSMAFCQMQLKAPDMAKQSLMKAKPYAKTPAEIAETDRMIQYLENRTNNPAAETQVAMVHKILEASTVAEEDARPILRRQIEQRLKADWEQAGDSRIAQAQNVIESAGTLEALECQGEQARFHFMDTDGKKMVLLIENPALIRIEGKAAGTVDLTCGPQKARVRVGFSPRVDEKKGTAGLVRSIVFE